MLLLPPPGPGVLDDELDADAATGSPWLRTAFPPTMPAVANTPHGDCSGEVMLHVVDRTHTRPQIFLVPIERTTKIDLDFVRHVDRLSCLDSYIAAAE